MKANVYSLAGTKIGDITLPNQFREPVRKDLIKRAVLAVQSNKYQPHGTDPLAGTKQGDATPKRRHKYRTLYGRGVSRVRRKIMSRAGLRINYVAAFVANAVKGRKAFPPTAEKILAKKVNVKERRKAIRSALAATAIKELVEARNHQSGKDLPLIVEDEIEGLKKSKDVKNVLLKLGLGKELKRASVKKIRAGRGTMRGRKYKTRVGPLIVVGRKCSLIRAGNNIPGLDISTVDSLNAELLAPGTVPGRLAIFTKSAIERLSKEGLFE